MVKVPVSRRRKLPRSYDVRQRLYVAEAVVRQSNHITRYAEDETYRETHCGELDPRQEAASNCEDYGMTLKEFNALFDAMDERLREEAHAEA